MCKLVASGTVGAPTNSKDSAQKGVESVHILCGGDRTLSEIFRGESERHLLTNVFNDTVHAALVDSSTAKKY